MPVYGYPKQPDPKRMEAWREHYRKKGCSEEKAQKCAHRKIFKETWPP